MFEGVRKRQTYNCIHLTRVVVINLQRTFCSVIMNENFMYV